MRRCFGSLLALGAAAASSPAAAQSYLDRTPEKEIVYFVLPDRFENGDTANDRGGFRGGRLDHGFDPAHKGFYHGGDLKGLTDRLDYLEGLGITAIWLGPIYKNKPVQGRPGQESSGYHGYWITDFTDVDPHFGTRADLKRFVDSAHARGMKIYLDIITNHTADVIKYRECPKNDCAYRSIGEYPFTTRGGPDGPRINEGFRGIDRAGQHAANFEKLKRFDYAYTPYVPQGEARAKTPAWLNDPAYYHNRGDSQWRGESNLHGDFSGLDDLFTEHPRVLSGMIDIFGQWIDDFGMDGFRIDTARHVNPEFWQAFVPAMQDRAKARGIPNFHIFGEVFDPDPGMLARFTKVDGYPTLLDFAFQSAVSDVVARNAGTDRLARLFQMDAVYEGGDETAKQLPTFLGNHDMGRIGYFIRQGAPAASEEEVLKRTILAHAMMFFARGVPVIYYGDEQGFTGDGGDQDAREDMFPSKVVTYNDNRLIGSAATTAQANFDSNSPLYRAIARMAAIRKGDPALSSGDQIVRTSSDKPGIFAISRRAPSGGGETLTVFNTGTSPITTHVQVDTGSSAWQPLHGRCAPSAAAPGSYRVEVAPLDYIVCKAAPR
jgi:glycosidase